MRACARRTARTRCSTASTSTSRPERCSRCSGRTAPGRRPRSRSSRATASATAATSTCSAPIPAARIARSARIGIVLQSSAVYPTLSVDEILRLFAGYHERPRDADEVVRLVGLEEKREARVRTLLRRPAPPPRPRPRARRRPELVFLDEPTTGFDPAARRRAWETIRGLRALGKTILLTTHYLEEAQSSPTARDPPRRAHRLDRPRPDLLADQATVEIRYRENGREVVVDGRAHAHAPRADRRCPRRRPRARRPRGSPPLARGRLPRADPRGATRDRASPPRDPRPAEALLA